MQGLPVMVDLVRLLCFPTCQGYRLLLSVTGGVHRADQLRVKAADHTLFRHAECEQLQQAG